MKRVIRFQRTRYIFFAFSGSLFILGALFFIFKGFNLGVDFKAGVAIQFQIAPASFALSYSGPDRVEATLPTGDQALTASGDFIITMTDPATSLKTEHPFSFKQYTTIRALADAIAAIPGFTVTPEGNMDLPPSQIVPPVSTANITAAPFTFNIEPQPGAAPVKIDDVRTALEPVGKFDLQTAGAAGSQQFLTKIQANTDDPTFQVDTQNQVKKLLEQKFGANQIIIKQSDFVGPRVSQALGRQSVWLVLIAIVLILIYMMFRFKPVYAVAAVLALVHDALIMLTYNAVFGIEMDAGTIAAILTILGYSINDTIVIFDRVRENQNLMRGSSLELMLDTSVSQTLGRTFITSGATLLTVISLFIFTTGSMKLFSINMLVGIIEGSYSTIFIASPIVLEWENFMERRRKKRDKQRFGIGTVETAKAVEAEEEEIEEGGQEEALPVNAAPVTPPQAGADGSAAAPGSEAPGAQPPAQTDGASDGTAKPADGKILSYPGGQNQAYRHHHKRHRGRHHH